MTSDAAPEMPNPLPVKRSASAAVLPPNDPARKDWGVLSDSLGLKERFTPPAGCSPEEGARLMTDLLLRIVQNDRAYEALIMKCAGETIAGKMREDVAGRASFEEMISFLKSRLWNRRADGTKTVSRKGREYSSNDVIQAWEPAAGGIVKYVQVQVSNILNRDWKQVLSALSNPYKVSVEVLAAKNRHLDTTGQIYVPTQQNAGADSDAPDYVEDPEALDRATERRGLAGSEPEDEIGEDELTDEEASAREEDAEEKMTPQRSLFEAVRLPSSLAKRNSAILQTTEHPDFQLLAAAGIADAQEPGLDQEERTIQLREMAAKVIETHYGERPDLREVLEAVESWDPTEYSFANYFPEVCDEIGKTLDGIGKKSVVNPQQELFQTIDFIAINDEFQRQSRGIRARPAGWSAEAWADERETVESWFSARATDPEMLLSCDRPDYLALCALTDRKPERDLEPEELSVAIKTMYREWSGSALATARRFGSHAIQVLSDNHAAVIEMNKRMESWDPLTQGYVGEAMVSFLHEVKLEQLDQEKERRAQEAEALRSVEHTHRLREPRRTKLPANTTLSLFSEEMDLLTVSRAPLPTPQSNHEHSL